LVCGGWGIAAVRHLAAAAQSPILVAMETPEFAFPQARHAIGAPLKSSARFAIGDVVRHKLFDFRGVVFDIDPIFANSEEWYEAIPEAMRPRRDQPFYHLMAENEDASYIAYVSQQNLEADGDGGPVDHPGLGQLFDDYAKGRYVLRRKLTH
jgi:heat shock protein HspQ